VSLDDSLQEALKNKCPACGKRFRVPQPDFFIKKGHIKCPLCRTPIRRSKEAIEREKKANIFLVVWIVSAIYIMFFLPEPQNIRIGSVVLLPSGLFIFWYLFRTIPNQKWEVDGVQSNKKPPAT
jgi:endogenous inhibitor of DNA gyrase (YacG/DUF329 family)